MADVLVKIIFPNKRIYKETINHNLKNQIVNCTLLDNLTRSYSSDWMTGEPEVLLELNGNEYKLNYNYIGDEYCLNKNDFIKINET